MHVSRWRTLVATALIGLMSAASAWAQSTVEPTLMDVRLGRSASLAVRAERAGERVWLPLAELAAALELEVVRRTRGRVELRRWPSRDLLVFDGDSMFVRLGARPLRIAPGALRQGDGELLADITTLQAVLRTSLEVSWMDLVVSLPVIDSLPLGRRLAREQARAQLLARSGGDSRDEVVAPLARPLADGAVVDYSLTVPLTGSQRTLGWSSAVGLDVLGGSFEMSTGAVTGGVRLPTLASWTGVWRNGSKLTQMRLGDGLGGGPLPRLGRGLMLTNAPYVRPALFGLQTLRGDLPPGWTIEAYRNGELVAVDTVGRGSGYLLQLPVLYGENPVDLLAVGPFGQTRALSENLRILADLLPRDKSEYGASFSQCRLRQQCIAAGTLDLRVGLTERWTMRVGVDGVARDSVGWRQVPYLSFVGAPMSSVAVQLDASAQSRTRLAVNLEPSRQIRLSLEQSWFGVDPIDPLLTARRKSQSSVYGFWRSLDERQTSVEGSVDRSHFLDGGDLTRARIGVGTQAAGLRLQPYLRFDQSSRGSYSQGAAGIEAMLLPNGARGRYFGASLLRMIGEVDTRGRPVREAMTLAMPLPGSFRIDAGVAFQRGQRGPLATLSLSRDLNALRSYTSSTMSRDGSSAVQSVQGSALLQRGANRPQFVTGPSLQRTGVAGVVFLDRNANGLRDAGEPLVPGVIVQVGTGHARSDSAGRYRVWDLVPFVPLPVAIDSTSLPSPLWIPTIAHGSIEAGPNHYEPLDIPLVAGGVLEGRVIWERPGGTSLPPVPLIVSNARGDVIARTESFSDGEFVLFGVRPGALTVRVDPAWLAQQRARASSGRVTLLSSDDGSTARVPAITITTVLLEEPCEPGAGVGCRRGHDDLRDGGSEERVRLLQTDQILPNLCQVAAQWHCEVAAPAVIASRDGLTREWNDAPIEQAGVRGERAGAAAIDLHDERTGVSAAGNTSEGERAPKDSCRRADRGELRMAVHRKEAARDNGGRADGEMSEHDYQSRQETAVTRDLRRRAVSVRGATSALKSTAARATRSVRQAESRLERKAQPQSMRKSQRRLTATRPRSRSSTHRQRPARRVALNDDGPCGVEP